MIEKLKENDTAKNQRLQNGDIICFQREWPVDEAMGPQPGDQKVRKPAPLQAKDYYQFLLTQDKLIEEPDQSR